ncbi:MAG: hypothetical protein Q7V20_05735 [Aquabacterium sp.]|uniref:hypothetical protein n=1 Tax=Aquabacterium sp. TaxID=1872578 RepID=UPI0027206122|nr:hypothetical protein [Aquabacterium sp.]MDO9002937.1 hypothetical protein [Aquabacterium sp.]
MNGSVWAPKVFTKNREQLIERDSVVAFMWHGLFQRCRGQEHALAKVPDCAKWQRMRIKGSRSRALPALEPVASGAVYAFRFQKRPFMN